MQPTAQLAAKISLPVELPSQAGAKGYIIQAFVAPAMLGAANAQAVGRSFQLRSRLLFLGFLFITGCARANELVDIPTGTITKPPATISYKLVDVSPACPDEPDQTRVIQHGSDILMTWTWVALTKDNVQDFQNTTEIEFKINQIKIDEVKQSPIYFGKNVFRVDIYKSIGVLDKGSYIFEASIIFKAYLTDGWKYYGPGTNTNSIDYKCTILIT
jgi:hypothetical protein